MRGIYHYAVLAMLWQLSQAQQNQLVDFCRRFGHQTAVIGRKLFIDGGLINFNPLQQNPLNYTNTNLLYADLDVNNDGMPNEYNNLTKQGSVPSVEGGILWPDSVNMYLYVYGGDFYQTSPQSFELWQYDVVYDNWTSVNPDVTQADIDRSTFGAGTVAEDIAKGFWYGGWLTNESVPEFTSNPLALSTFIEYDMLANTWKNSSGPDSVGRAEGTMVYIPASDGGMLIYLGGVQTPYGNGTVVAQPMNEIIIYDIANARWYTQAATGEIPESRRLFCAGAAWPEDRSSYNIYLYGGASVGPGTGFDDVYILSLPTFTWIKWWPTTPGTAYPHHSLSCNVIDGAQMIIMGGTFPNSSQCDNPSTYGMHNLDLGKQNQDDALWYEYRPSITSYQLPTEIVSVVGGAATGGATKKTPSNGFDDRDLSVYFTRVYTPSPRAATRVIPATASPTTTSSKSNGKSKPLKAIIGGAVGGGVVLLAFIGAAIFCCTRMRKKRLTPVELEHKPSPQELPLGEPHRSSAPHYVSQLPDNGMQYLPPVELPSVDAQAAATKLPRYSYTPVSSDSITHTPHGSPPQSPPPLGHNYHTPAQDSITPTNPSSYGAEYDGYIQSPRYQHGYSHSLGQFHQYPQYPSPQHQYPQPYPQYPSSLREQAYSASQQYFPPPPEPTTPRSARGYSNPSPSSLNSRRVQRKEVPVHVVYDGSDFGEAD